jgi:hypothetical protein
LGALAALLLAGPLALAQGPAAPEGGAKQPEVLPPPRLPAPSPPAAATAPAPSPLPPVAAPEDDSLVPCGDGFADADWRLCGPPGRIYGSAEYLLWWTKGQQMPALATIGSTADMPPGALGQPSTVEVLGDRNADTQVRSGARFTAGEWITADQTIGVEAGVFFLEPHSTRMGASSDGSVLLARPFFAVGNVTLPDGTQQTLAQEDALIIANPGVSSGSIHMSTQNKFWGAEANARCNLCGDCFYRADLLAGFRFLELKDSLSIVSVSDTIPPSGPTTVADVFHTVNQFYGGQVGAALNFCRGRWTLDFRGEFALGAIRRVAAIEGATIMTAGGTTSSVAGGLFVQPTNIGRHTSVAFGVVPELGVRANYQITRFLRAYTGYSFIYLARNVAQPGDQIDRAVNVNQIPALGRMPLSGDARPAFGFQNTDFWAQGFDFGLELNF